MFRAVSKIIRQEKSKVCIIVLEDGITFHLSKNYSHLQVFNPQKPFFFVSRYKQRCDEMRRQYDTRLANFYEEHPTLRPVKPDKAKKALVRIYLELKINKHVLL